MGAIGSGYGSECHLLRYLGRHRGALDAAVRHATGADAVSWLDFPFDPKAPWRDGEWKGVGFLPEDHPARLAWATFWPQRGNPPNWDAVGRVQFGGRWEWLLVEAKAHLGELHSDCQAKEAGGRPQIRAALDRVKSALSVSAEAEWLTGHYQYANRLAALWHLHQHAAPARLLFVYFTGEDRTGWQCPKDGEGWSDAIQERHRWLSLPDAHALSPWTHDMFLPVAE